MEQRCRRIGYRAVAVLRCTMTSTLVSFTIGPGSGQQTGFDQLIEGHHGFGGSADLNKEGRHTEGHAFAGKALALTLERLALTILLKRCPVPT